MIDYRKANTIIQYIRNRQALNGLFLYDPMLLRISRKLDEAQSRQCSPLPPTASEVIRGSD